jgi:hypothetical protein
MTDLIVLSTLKNPSLHEWNGVLLKTRIAHEMLRDAAFDLVGQVSVRTADHASDVAATRLISAIEDAAQNATEVLTSSSYSSVHGTVPFHGNGYRELTIQLQTKLNDGSIAWADSQVAQPGLLPRQRAPAEPQQ